MDLICHIQKMNILISLVHLICLNQILLTMVGDGSSTAIAQTHALGTSVVSVQLTLSIDSKNQMSFGNSKNMSPIHVMVKKKMVVGIKEDKVVLFIVVSSK